MFLFPLGKFWTYSPRGFGAAIIWNCCEVLGVRVPHAPVLFGWIIGVKGQRATTPAGAEERGDG